MNVNIFTAMIGTIVFGIGVDDAIHVMHRIQEEKETPVGISKAISETGQTIFETTITTVSGLCAGLFLAFLVWRTFPVDDGTDCFCFPHKRVFIACNHYCRTCNSAKISEKRLLD